MREKNKCRHFRNGENFSYYTHASSHERLSNKLYQNGIVVLSHRGYVDDCGCARGINVTRFQSTGGKRKD